jgi:hypothetical protein
MNTIMRRAWFSHGPTAIITQQVLFTQGGKTLPGHCRSALKRLRQSNRPVQGFLRIMRCDGTATGGLHSAPLSTSFHFIQEQPGRLVDLPDIYQCDLYNARQQAQQRRKEIEETLETLLPHLTDLSHRSALLLDVAQLHGSLAQPISCVSFRI